MTVKRMDNGKWVDTNWKTLDDIITSVKNKSYKKDADETYEYLAIIFGDNIEVYRTTKLPFRYVNDVN